MPHPRTIRAWLRRGNLVLVLLLVVTAATTFPVEREQAPPLEYGRGENARDVSAVITRPVDDPTELLALVHRFHPHREPPLRTAPQAPTGATRLPLRAFQVAMVVRLGPSRDTLMLKSKDPSRAEAYFLRGREPDGDARVVKSRYDGNYGYFLVQRGAETFEFKHRFDEPARGSTVRLVRAAPVVAARSTPSAKSPARAGSSARSATTLKGLPFFGRGGAVVGFRVTGVRPGSWATRLGLKPGDVIKAAGPEGVRDATAFRTRLASGWEPSDLVVERGSGARRETLTLRGS